MMRSVVVKVWSRLRRHSVRTWLLWGLGVVALLATSMSLFDPVLLTFVVDPELLALFVDSAVLYAVLAVRSTLPAMRGSVRRAWMADPVLRWGARGHLAVTRVVG